jgi:starvation-inducible DNA-binding protein
MTNNILNKTNKYLADIAVSDIKIHNLHWNVVGLQFKAIHEFLEGIYDSYAEALDEIAEFIKINGAYPAASLKEYLELSDIEELGKEDIKIENAVRLALENQQALKNEALELRAEADKEDNFSLVNLLEDQIDGYNKNIWFLESSLK